METFVHERLNKYAQDNARAIAHIENMRPAYRIPPYLWEMMPHYINECYPIVQKAREQFSRGHGGDPWPSHFLGSNKCGNMNLCA